MGSSLRQGWSKILCRGIPHSLSPSPPSTQLYKSFVCTSHVKKPVQIYSFCSNHLFSHWGFLSAILFFHLLGPQSPKPQLCPDLRLPSLPILTLVLRGCLNWVSVQTKLIIHSLWADFLYSILGHEQYSTLFCQGAFVTLTMYPIFTVLPWQQKMLNNKARH